MKVVKLATDVCTVVCEELVPRLSSRSQTGGVATVTEVIEGFSRKGCGRVALCGLNYKPASTFCLLFLPSFEDGMEGLAGRGFLLL